MHPLIYKAFEKICSESNCLIGSVLEVGAIPSSDSLLCMKSLDNFTEKVGINLDGPYKYKDFFIFQGNANHMTCFENDSFNLVLCNATLEHDKFFWKTISEIKRVTKPGGQIVIGVPGYRTYAIETIIKKINKIPFLEKTIFRHSDFFNNSTLTFKVHQGPGDYYRFSEQTCREVLLEGLINIKAISVMTPPRFISWGTKPYQK